MSEAQETKDEKSERIEIRRFIPADVARVFSVVRDPEGHVTIDSTGMLQSWTGEPASKVGDEFVIHMDRESLNDYPMGKYDVTVKFTRYEHDRAIAWTIEGQIKPQIGHVYGYELEPVDGGTRVRESWDISQEKVKAMVRPARKRTIKAMEETLARIEQLVTT